MPTFKADLSTESLGVLLNNVREYRKRVETLKTDLPTRLAERAEDKIEMHLLSIIERDGNVEVYHNMEASNNHASVWIDGRQAKYIEFGTGVNGMSSPHPMSANFAWDYNSGSKIHTLKDGQLGWVWIDLAGNPHSTHGIAAQEVVYKAAQETRKEILQTAKELLENG